MMYMIELRRGDPVNSDVSLELSVGELQNIS